MAKYVKISTIGSRPLGGDPPVGPKAVDRMIDHWRAEFDKVLPEHPDLILVPECCDRYSGHSSEKSREFYRARRHRVGDFFAQTAYENHCYVAYPAVRQLEDGTWRNSIELFDRGGRSMGFYNKNYPVITENTEGGILSGRDAPLFKCDFGTVAGAICFDLNFDGIRLKYVKSHPDVILFASMYHGGLMQNYWAYSCRAYLVTAVAGAPSGILSPAGTPLATTTNYFDYVTAVVNLDCAMVHLDFNRSKLSAVKLKYGPDVRIFDPGFLGSVLLFSETDKVSCDELIEEFGIERLDDYMARSATHAEAAENREPEGRADGRQ